MISSRKVANAMGAKTARPCDSCMKKRARWYCVADDAFLCQACDSSVHSANPLARRHERVRLKTASSSLKSLALVLTEKKINDSNTSTGPSWHKGFTRKARTPRGKQAAATKDNNVTPASSLVPEVGSDDVSNIEENHNEEEQLHHRVPIFDPFVAGLCSSATAPNSPQKQQPPSPTTTTSMNVVDDQSKEGAVVMEVESLHGLSASDMDHTDQFAADVESLLGTGLEGESFGMEELGFVDCSAPKLEEDEEKKDYDDHYLQCNYDDINGCLLLDSNSYNNSSSRKVKLEELEEEEEKRGVRVRISDDHDVMDIGKDDERFELSFDDDGDHNNDNENCDDFHHNWTCGVTCEEGMREMNVSNCSGEHDAKSNSDGGNYEEKSNKMKKIRKVLLSLDYEGVITAWASHGSPWITGDRLDLDPHDCWPNCKGTCGIEFQGLNANIDSGSHAGQPTMAGDKGREARVSRYREKRRTRLFSKKIRYEVRKLNAEKRPRMKGRFVKRATTSVSAAPPSFPLLNK